MLGIKQPPPFWAKQLGKPGLVDRWQIITFQVPCVVRVAPVNTGAQAGDRSQGVNGFFLGVLVPETERTCHHFWNFVRSFRTGDEALTRSIQLAHVNLKGKGLYDQDATVLQAQRRAIERNPRMPFYNLNIDAGALWAHRLIDGLIQAEAVGQPALPSVPALSSAAE